MDFEFDKNKSRANQQKHGINFNTAQKLWDDPNRVIIPAKHLDEPRYLLLGMIHTQIWSAIYTIRNQKIRIISVRRARKDEKEIYKSGRI